ncbi:hypothetical protein B0A50_02343 [Salinomyces thailandicus]|uniref:Tetraspanin Tsp3 n=1 Tax=Salinomyces thailandicus TaxID=706561 RepID=A0A4U0U627_9PEZI|nr:hypothetical protein B0A50_02343 [Salinomyces thailandica]
MAPTKRQLTLALSVTYLAALTVLAAYALHSAHAYSLPIPSIACALTLALPPLAGVALETVLTLNNHLTRKGQVQTSRILQITVVAFLIYETALATLAGTHLSPSGSLDCALRERWTELRHARDGAAIKGIQDAFRCCGLMSTRDMAWPFADKRHGVEACVVRYERSRACMEPWRREEQKVAVLLLVVPVAVFLWKVLVLLAPSSTSTWLPSRIRLPDGETPAGARPRQAIEYRDVEGSEAESVPDSVRDEVRRLNKDSNMASHVEGERRKSIGHGLRREHVHLRDADENA